MPIEHQIARLTPQSPPIISLPPGGVPKVTKEMVALAAASLQDDLAYHLVMGRYTDCTYSKNKALPSIERESRRIWTRAGRGKVRKINSFDLLTILIHAIWFRNPESEQAMTAAGKARFCEISATTWHDKWAAHYDDVMASLDTREQALKSFITRNIYCG